ncbi:hypothetical protein DAETH_14050 [Deinococcus aetherius]|uniref:Uncharacterized protein n=1 Tax=Deinococcus aetherius TaxID=200252 RepID=A0ABM8ACH2_9DEIO|nr:hypothetical protein [Deinococcus aetherius]BDP41436.1 hypothetical protein DAETH_14050 [Deinococcus aetherius]
MLPVLLTVLIVFLNLGGVASILLEFGHGERGPGVSSLVILLALDAVGFWLLRRLREPG